MTTRQTTVIEQDPTTHKVAPIRWWARRRWQALAVALGVVAATGAVYAGTRGEAEELPRSSPRTTYGFNEMAPGATFAMGNLRISEPGKTVQIVSAKALTSANVEYLGAYTVWPRDYFGITTDDTFPSPAQKVRHQLNEPVPPSWRSRILSSIFGRR
ncbi:MAG: hypothetical protein ACT4QG_03740 [Sporichthyaceae bacterium]